MILYLLDKPVKGDFLLTREFLDTPELSDRLSEPKWEGDLSVDASRMIRRARFYYLLDNLFGVVRFPLRLLVWLLSVLYLLFCAICWGIILWVLGEKHIGILKLLLLLSSVAVWILLFFSIYSLWFLGA